MGYRLNLCIIVALFMLLGHGAFADEAPLAAAATDGKLACMICNDALGNDYACTKEKQAKVQSRPCNSLDDVIVATKALTSLGGGGTPPAAAAEKRNTEIDSNAIKDLKMSSEFMNSVKVLKYNGSGEIKFACRRYSVEIGENDDSKDKRRERVIGTCGMYFPEHDHEDSKLDCITKAGSAKTKFISCKCDQNDCNGAGRLSQGVHAMLIVGVLIGLLASFKRAF